VILGVWLATTRLRSAETATGDRRVPLRPAKGPPSEQRSSSRNGGGEPSVSPASNVLDEPEIRDVTDRDYARFAPSQKSRTTSVLHRGNTDHRSTYGPQEALSIERT
jgi:hypothetical protein